MNKLFVLIQTLVPQHALSRLVAVFANSKVGFIKDTFIRGFIKRYKVDMSEARFSDVDNYNSFNDFFTRKLEATARPINSDSNAIICPVDGAASFRGTVIRLVS